MQISRMQDQESRNELSESETALAKDSCPVAAPASEPTFLPVNKWGTDKCLEWLNKKLQHHSPSASAEQVARLNKIFASKRITGEVLLELNNDYLEYMSISESRLKEILLEEIALLKIRNEYEFIRRFKSQTTEAENN